MGRNGAAAERCHLCGGQFFTAGGAAAVDDLAAVFGFHSFAESAGFLALVLAGLVGAFHVCFLGEYFCRRHYSRST